MHREIDGIAVVIAYKQIISSFDSSFKTNPSFCYKKSLDLDFFGMIKYKRKKLKGEYYGT